MYYIFFSNQSGETAMSITKLNTVPRPYKFISRVLLWEESRIANKTYHCSENPDLCEYSHIHPGDRYTRKVYRLTWEKGFGKRFSQLQVFHYHDYPSCFPPPSFWNDETDDGSSEQFDCPQIELVA